LRKTCDRKKSGKREERNLFKKENLHGKRAEETEEGESKLSGERSDKDGYFQIARAEVFRVHEEGIQHS